MNKFSFAVTKYKRSIITAFVVLAVLSGIFSALVQINYKMADYLPKGAQSTEAIRVLQDEFGSEIPNARVMVNGVTMEEALEYKGKLAAVDGVSGVTWLDDAAGQDMSASTAASAAESELLEKYYKDGSALFTVTIESGKEKSAVAAIRDLIGVDNAVAGDAVNTAAAQEMSSSEVIKALAILLPVILIILILSTSSWIEPLLFLLSIGVAVLINMGTNIFFGEISFITQTVSPILQLAVSLDYAIFLLHSFNEYRLSNSPREAMRLAMKKAFSAVAASAATTVIGFVALTIMRFGIGSDLGINLVKGVLLSFISVMVFLPALTLGCYGLIDKTRHRRFFAGRQRIGKWLTKIRIPFLILAVIIAVPCFMAQLNNEFVYETSGVAEATRAGKDAEAIEARFGRENALVLLVPKGKTDEEAELCASLAGIPHITEIVSYVISVGAEIPLEYVSKDVAGQFYSENYARIILYTDMDEEGEETFAAVRSVMAAAEQHYGEYHLAGQSASLYDIKNVVSTDTKSVNLAAIIGIFLVLLLTFRSPTTPLLLLFTIETAIWINLSIARFTGQPLNFIGYLVVSTVQLGATVDYAILLTDRYLSKRKELPKKEAMIKAIEENLTAVIISAMILATAGFTLALTSSNPIIAELGALLGRGTVLSFVMVACVLPALLMLFDKVIQKTTLRNGFDTDRGEK